MAADKYLRPLFLQTRISMSTKSEEKQLRKRPLYSQEIRDAIQRAILNEELKPGDRVVETRWARELGVSQSPVREALRELEMMGLVENKPFQGAFVREIDQASIIDNYNVLRGLETVGVEAAVAKITDAQLVEIYLVMRDMEQAAKNESSEPFIEKDRLFHQRILEVSENKLLLQLWSQCKIREHARISTTLSRSSMDVLTRRHSAMYDALAKRNAAAAVEAVNSHFTFLIGRIEKLNFEELRAAKSAAGRAETPPPILPANPQ